MRDWVYQQTLDDLTADNVGVGGTLARISVRTAIIKIL